MAEEEGEGTGITTKGSSREEEEGEGRGSRGVSCGDSGMHRTEPEEGTRSGRVDRAGAMEGVSRRPRGITCEDMGNL